MQAAVTTKLSELMDEPCDEVFPEYITVMVSNGKTIRFEAVRNVLGRVLRMSACIIYRFLSTAIVIVPFFVVLVQCCDARADPSAARETLPLTQLFQLPLRQTTRCFYDFFGLPLSTTRILGVQHNMILLRMFCRSRLRWWHISIVW